MSDILFISYSRADLHSTDWLGKLKMYLAPLRRNGTIDAWDDGRIAPGTQWKAEIDRALKSASAAVLLVGPGYLASDFVMEQELPKLIETGRVTLFPLVVGFCGYEQSALARYQAFNDLEQPLESLTHAEQNKILNALAIAIDNTLRPDQRPARDRSTSDAKVLRQAMEEIQRRLTDTRTAFAAQRRRRDALVSAIEQRMGFKNYLEYEKFFFQYHAKLNETERFEFDQIRAMTEGPIQLGNRKVLELIETHPEALAALPLMTPLRQHLVFWLNKYDKVFSINPAMCVLYAGVEDGVPFPKGVDTALSEWLLATSLEET